MKNADEIVEELCPKIKQVKAAIDLAELRLKTLEMDYF